MNIRLFFILLLSFCYINSSSGNNNQKKSAESGAKSSQSTASVSAIPAVSAASTANQTAAHASQSTDSDINLEIVQSHLYFINKQKNIKLRVNYNFDATKLNQITHNLAHGVSFYGCFSATNAQKKVLIFDLPAHTTQLFGKKCTFEIGGKKTEALTMDLTDAEYKAVNDAIDIFRAAQK